MSQALAAHQTGALGEAERLYNRVLAASPDHPLASYNLALILVDSGRLRAARIRLQSLLKAQPQDAPAHYTLGKVFQAEGDLIKSLDHLRRAQALSPDQLDAYLELIGTYGRLGRFDDAREIAAVGSRQLPRAAEIPTKLGLAMLSANRPGEAREQFERALALNPAHVLALYNLGKLTDELGDAGAALALYRRARDHDPSFEPAAFNIAELELRLGEVELAVAEIEALLKRNPGDAATLSSRLMAAQYERGVSATRLMALHRAWDRQLGDRLLPTIPRRRQKPDPNRRLRVGLVSPDLGDHPVGYFTIGAVEGLDPAAIELVAYAGAAREDAISGRFRRRIARWRDTTNWSDEQLAEHIARERIDILIDLSGHTRGNRLPAFSRRPALVQLSWAGYVGTTGLKAIDGLIADRFHIPLGEEAAYGEKVIRLPDGYICFDPPAEAPDVTPLPAGAAGPLTFASFHLPTKINAGVTALWAQIMNAEPGSRLMFVYAGYEVAEVQARIRGWFAAAGVTGDRLSFEGRLPRAALLQRYGGIDIALDSFPYSGGLTTCEALWMGVPVVTMPGESFAGRHAFSHLSNVGLTETIARSPEDYVAIVHRLGADREKLAGMRAGLRERLSRSALCDGPRFARHLETGLREIWQDFCAGRLPLRA